jgi:hypothetical protein
MAHLDMVFGKSAHSCSSMIGGIEGEGDEGVRLEAGIVGSACPPCRRSRKAEQILQPVRAPAGCGDRVAEAEQISPRFRAGAVAVLRQSSGKSAERQLGYGQGDAQEIAGRHAGLSGQFVGESG